MTNVISISDFIKNRIKQHNPQKSEAQLLLEEVIFELTYAGIITEQKSDEMLCQLKKSSGEWAS